MAGARGAGGRRGGLGEKAPSGLADSAASPARRGGGGAACGTRTGGCRRAGSRPLSAAEATVLGRVRWFPEDRRSLIAALVDLGLVRSHFLAQGALISLRRRGLVVFLVGAFGGAVVRSWG